MKMTNDDKADSRKGSRIGIIQAVQTPLGFFVLVVLVFEGILGATASLAKGLNSTYIVWAMIALIFLLVGIVAFLAYYRPEALRGLRWEPNASSQPPVGAMKQGNVDSQPAVIDNIQKFDTSLIPKHCREVHILASGMETSFNLVEGMLSRGNLQHGLRINVAYRESRDVQRMAKIVQYQNKWRQLSQEYQATLQFYATPDFLLFLRGIVFDKNLGCIGFYYRDSKKNKTIGASRSCLVVDDKSPIGGYLLACFLECFEYIPSDSAIKMGG